MQILWQNSLNFMLRACNNLGHKGSRVGFKIDAIENVDPLLGTEDSGKGKPIPIITMSWTCRHLFYVNEQNEREVLIV